MAHWVMEFGFIPLLVPTPSGNLDYKKIVDSIDGLILHGGADLSPKHFGEEPLQEKWAGDPIRDLYEMELYRETLAQEKPILGVCRGAQLINVAQGGSLYQDISTQLDGTLTHRDPVVYDDLCHEVVLEEGSYLKKLYQQERATTNSVHHQSIKNLGKDLVVEALSPKDDIIEAIRLEKTDGSFSNPYVLGVQWHPEFMTKKDESFFSARVLMEDFLKQVQGRRVKKE